MTAGAVMQEERRRTVLLVRYVLILAGAALAIVREPPPLPLSTLLLIVAALASNVALGRVRTTHFFHWAVQGLVVILDTLWVSVMLLAAHLGQEFFLFFFVLFLAAISESLGLLAVAALLMGTASVVLAGPEAMTAASLVRVPFYFTAAIFYGYILDMTKKERRLAVEREAWAKRLEEEVRARTETLERQSSQLRTLYDRLLEANRLKSEFVANMSHELRSPLHVIVGYSDLLIGGDFGSLSEDATRVCAHIHHSATALHRLLVNLLDFAKLEQQQVAARPVEVSIPRLVRKTLADACQPSPPGLSFEVNVPPELPVMRTDAQKLGTILEQLLSNAIKFTPPGGRIAVAAEDLAGCQRVRFVVQDTGVGIGTEHLKLIFEDFRQIDGTSTRAHGGIGLGLALVRRYLSLLDGEITVASELGRGSTFSFTLPYRLAVQSCESAPPVEANDSEAVVRSQAAISGARD